MRSQERHVEMVGPFAGADSRGAVEVALGGRHGDTAYGGHCGERRLQLQYRGGRSEGGARALAESEDDGALEIRICPLDSCHMDKK